MKSKVFAAICFFLFLSQVQISAQEGPRDPMCEGSWLLNFGIGPGIRYYTGYRTGFGPGFQASFEKGMWQLGPGVLTLGGELGFSYFWYSYYNDGTLDYKYSWLSVIPAARCSYHYGWKVKGLDTYGGVSTGPRFAVFSYKYYNNFSNLGYHPGSVGFFFGTYVGASYFFNSTLGINGEFGYNINWAQVGLVFKLN